MAAILSYINVRFGVFRGVSGFGFWHSFAPDIIFDLTNIKNKGGSHKGESPPDEVLGPHQVVTPPSLKTQISQFRDIF